MLDRIKARRADVGKRREEAFAVLHACNGAIEILDALIADADGATMTVEEFQDAVNRGSELSE